ncbi:MAG: cryptochrome/photolyase family protein [Bacteroidota bacterium]
MSRAINLLFPHQLFADHTLPKENETYLIEEHLFFKQYHFHQQKIAFHRASMRTHQAYLEEQGITVHYVEATDERSDIRQLLPSLREADITGIYCYDPVDNYLERRLRENAGAMDLEMVDSPLFINQKADLSKFFRADKKSFFQTTFYKQQRKKLNLLMDSDGEPAGGKWTYDVDNRKKYPKDKTPPAIHPPAADATWEEAVAYTKQHFDHYPGEVTQDPIFPYTYAGAEQWLAQFLEFRFHDFGAYEDAIVADETFLNHSVLSPLINAGMLLPLDVVQRSIAFANDNDIPLNSTEGFVRQIIGWREFIRGMYECKGVYSRTENFWGFTRKIPPSFYDGTTGIPPIDQTIKKILRTGYCHHIERLMILGNFMLLCEFDPDEVYRWFMELFIDAYDWVMVPNVYGMSQFADGGTFATKPYIGGSNYVRKMSNYKRGDWCDTWDGLFWRFMDQHQAFFLKNPRLSMLVHSFNRMSDEKKETHLLHAEAFLTRLDASS